MGSQGTDEDLRVSNNQDFDSEVIACRLLSTAAHATLVLGYQVIPIQVHEVRISSLLWSGTQCIALSPGLP